MTTKTRAAIYCRISRDPEGIRAGVERQEEDCRALVNRSGFDLVGVFVDNDISASTLKKKTRPAYARMIKAAEAGEVDVIVAYSNSRLTRRLMELEDLIQLHEKHGTTIVTVVSGTDDLSTADGRMVSRIKASVDSAEAERTSERLRRAMLQRAKKGTTPQGPRIFGWQADKVHLDPVEAALVRAAAQDVLDGVSLRTVATRWRDQGVLTSRGGPWGYATLGRLLRNPRAVGWKTYHGDVLLDDVGEPVKGEWEPILDRDTFDRLQVALRRDKAAGTASGRRKYLLTGVVRCGVCGGRMYGVPRSGGGHAYTCMRERTEHTLTMVGAPLELVVTEVVKARLGRVDLSDVEPRRPVIPSTERLVQIPGLIAELMDAFNAGRVSGSIAFPQVAKLEAEKVTLEAERASMIATTAAPVAVSVDDFERLDVERQRSILETLFEAIVIAPAARKGEPFNPDRITYVWRQA